MLSLYADGMDLLERPVLQADQRIAYGSDPSQFGDLWLPATAPGQRVPLLVFFHGGWWKSAYDLGYAGYFCRALRQAGIAVWSVEYRRRGATGGGWPTTFQDAASGFDFAATLATKYPLDLSRVVTAGHSAGGHLAFWIAGRQHLEPGSALYEPRPQIALRGAVALAGAVDLRLTIELAGEGLFAHDRDEVHGLMGGTPGEYPERYRNGNPGDLLPLEAAQILIQGTSDDQIPAALPERWASLSQSRGSHASVYLLPGANHFDVVDPESKAWPQVLAHCKAALSDRVNRTRLP